MFVFMLDHSMDIQENKEYLIEFEERFLGMKGRKTFHIFFLFVCPVLKCQDFFRNNIFVFSMLICLT